jgi:hypothetical protein
MHRIRVTISLYFLLKRHGRHVEDLGVGTGDAEVERVDDREGLVLS